MENFGSRKYHSLSIKKISYFLKLKPYIGARVYNYKILNLSGGRPLGFYRVPSLVKVDFP